MASDNAEKMMSALKYLVVLVLLVVVVVGAFWRSGGDRKDTRQVYYFDEANNCVFIDSAGLIPPIISPTQQDSDEPAGVIARIFSCSGCAASYDGMTLEEVQRNGGFVAWLEKYTPEGQRMLSGGGGNYENVEFDLSAKHKLMRSPDSPHWVPVESPAANMIRSAMGSRCGNGSPRSCGPPTKP